MISNQTREDIRNLPVQELISYAIAQTELNESLARENDTLKRSLEYKSKINDNIFDLKRSIERNEKIIQKLQLLLCYLCKKSGLSRIGITEEDFNNTCSGHKVGVRDTENYGGDKIIEIVIK